MVRYYKSNFTDLTTSVWQKWNKWIIIGIILMFGLVNVNAIKCCYSTSYKLKEPPNTYQLNLTASHVDSKKGNNKYTAAISFPEGYSVIGEPYSPFNKLQCVPVTGTGAITQYQCDSKDRAMFFVTFDLSVKFLPQSNLSVTVSDVFIFGDKCQNVGSCTDLVAKNESTQDDKISLGPLGTWPRYAVIIGGVILALSLLIACYLVYKRNRPDDSFRDRSITPGSNPTYDDKRLFSPNSLLREENDLPPSIEPPKNTLIQFGSVTSNSPDRSKSVRNQHHQSSLAKSPTRRKKENNDNPGVVIEIPGNDGGGKNRKSKDKGNNNNASGYSNSDLSRTISINDNSDLSDNNNDHKHLSSIHRKKSKSKSRSVNSDHEHESRRGDRRSPINDNSYKPHKSSTTRSIEEDREGRRVDRTTSRKHSSRENSFSPSKSTSDLQTRHSTRQTDHDSAIKNKVSISHDKDTGKNSNKIPHSDTNLDKRKSNKRRDFGRKDSIESNVPLGDSLPLAMLAKSKSWRSDDDNNVENDDDTTPLGRISSYSAGKNKESEDNNNYDSIYEIIDAAGDNDEASIKNDR